MLSSAYCACYARDMNGARFPTKAIALGIVATIFLVFLNRGSPTSPEAIADKAISILRFDRIGNFIQVVDWPSWFQAITGFAALFFAPAFSIGIFTFRRTVVLRPIASSADSDGSSLRWDMKVTCRKAINSDTHFYISAQQPSNSVASIESGRSSIGGIVVDCDIDGRGNGEVTIRRMPAKASFQIALRLSDRDKLEIARGNSRLRVKADSQTINLFDSDPIPSYRLTPIMHQRIMVILIQFTAMTAIIIVSLIFSAFRA